MTPVPKPRIDILDIEGIPGLRDTGIGGEFYKAYQQANPHIHTHDIVELVYVCAGHGRHLLEHSEQSAGPGSLAIIHYNQAHGFNTGPHGLDLINLYLDLERFQLPVLSPELTHLLPRIIPMHPSLGHRRRNIVHIQFDDPPRIRHLLDYLLQEIRDPQPGHLDTIQKSLALFLTECCRQYAVQQKRNRGAPTAKSNPHPLASRLERLRQHIDTHFAGEVTLDDLARLAHLQKNYLCRVFKDYTGQTIFHYLMHRRLERALLLLRQTDSKIIDIAHDSGFNDLPHFNRIFKREIGLTPRAYRKQWEPKDHSG